MGKRDPRIDAYIARSAAFAQPILEHLRELVHAGCPEVEETLKWSAPHFMYKGMMAGMASFKGHCAFGFWKGSLLAQKHPELAEAADAGMGQLGRISSLADLPSDEVMIGYIKEAAALNDQGVKTPARTKKPPEDRRLEIPAYFMDALRRNQEALKTFEGFSPSHQREYAEWVTEAKTEETRQRRLAQAVEWMAEGKVRHWKYVKK